jgi:hypothetical protein
MTLVLTVETSFGGNEMQLAHVADYLNGHFRPCVESQPVAFPLFTESLTITTVALHGLFAEHSHCRSPLRCFGTRRLVVVPCVNQHDARVTGKFQLP